MNASNEELPEDAKETYNDKVILDKDNKNIVSINRLSSLVIQDKTQEENCK